MLSCVPLTDKKDVADKRSTRERRVVQVIETLIEEVGTDWAAAAADYKRNCFLQAGPADKQNVHLFLNIKHKLETQ